LTLIFRVLGRINKRQQMVGLRFVGDKRNLFYRLCRNDVEIEAGLLDSSFVSAVATSRVQHLDGRRWKHRRGTGAQNKSPVSPGGALRTTVHPRAPVRIDFRVRVIK